MALTILSVTLGTLAALASCRTEVDTRQESIAARLSDPGQRAFQTLLTTERFTSEVIGEDGITPVQVRALRTLWREPLADHALKELEERATTAGRLFALCGLYYADRDAFRKRVEPYRTSSETVPYLVGCEVISDHPVAQLVERSEPGAVRLSSNQTVEAWLAAQPTKERGHALDILGGGWPELFRVREPSPKLKTQLTEPGIQAFRRLMVAERFTDDAIYDGGVTPNEVIALRKLLKEPQAGAALEELERRASLPGCLFALCGLYYLDQRVFRERLGSYQGNEQTVFFQTGCEGIRDQPIAQLVDRGKGKAVRLAPGQSNREWLETHEGSHGYDIVGGGWSNLFRDGGGWSEVRDEDYSPDGD